MKSFSFLVIAITTVAESCAIPGTNPACCFTLTASGGQDGTVGQLDDGQARIGGGLPPSYFCMNGTSITDSTGRGCIVTEPQTQWQCDLDKSPFQGFTIGCNGLLSYNGSTTFWECQTGDNGEANIYITPGGTVCNIVNLTADNCLAC